MIHVGMTDEPRAKAAERMMREAGGGERRVPRARCEVCGQYHVRADGAEELRDCKRAGDGLGILRDNRMRRGLAEGRGDE